MTRILLLGYMGAGKTTIGRALAKRLNLAFYDLDWYISSRRRKTIAEIFKENGQEGFRIIERNLLHEVAEFEDVVISCGGGTPCFFDNMDYMNQQGTTIYLKASPDYVCHYLLESKNSRPLLEGMTADEMKAFINEHMSQREPYYTKAKITIDVTSEDGWKTEDEIIDSLVQELKGYEGHLLRQVQEPCSEG